MKRVLGVAGGNSIGQLVIFLFAPLITRIYSPDVFGIQGVFLAAVMLLTPLVTLRFPMAIVIAGDELDMLRIERLSWVSATAFSAIVLLSLLMFRNHVARALGLGEAGAVIFMLPAALMMVAFQEITLNKATRWESFRAISVASAAQAFVVNGAKVIGGVIAPVSLVLVTLASLGPGVHAAMLAFAGRGRHARDRSSIRLGSLWRTAVKYHDFALMRMPTDLLNAASQAAPVIFLGVFFNPVVAGWYALAKSVMAVPSNVIGNAAGTVFYSDFAERARRDLPFAGSLVNSTLLLLLGPGALLFAASFFFPSIFALAFGDEWREAGAYAQWMALWIGVALANVPSVRLAPVMRRQGVLLMANLMMLVLRIGSLFIGYWVFVEASRVVAVYSIVSAVCNLGLIGWIILLAKRHDLKRSLN